MNAIYAVDYLQAVEPEALAPEEGIEIIVSDEKDSMGFDRVTVLGPSREAVTEYVRREWGTDDEDWLKEWVIDRIERIPAETVTLTLPRRDVETTIEALELLAGIDEDEHTDYDALMRIARTLREKS